MKQYSVSVFLMLAFTLLPSCKHGETNPAVQVIDLAGVWDKPEEILLSSIATDIEYIPLETTPDCLLGEPLKLRIILMDNYILAGMNLFDRQGSFIAKVGRTGKGPQEYVGVASVACNEKVKRIDVKDTGSDRVISYGFNGEFIREIPIDPHGQMVVNDDSGRIGVMYLPWREDPTDTARFEWMNEYGKVIRSIPLYVGRPKDGGETWIIGARLYHERSRLCFTEVPYDTIYELVDDQEWKPRWAFGPWEPKMPREIWLDDYRWSQNRNHFNNIWFSAETSRFLFMYAENQGVIGQGVYDKVTRSARWSPGTYPPDSSYMITMTNDLDGGLLSVPNMLQMAQGDSYVTVLSPFDLIREFKNRPESKIKLVKPELREKLFTLVDRLKEDDNPVIMIVKLKT